MFESIITSTDSTISVTGSLVGIGCALVAGLLISFCYMFTQKKGTYTKDFVIATAVLPMVVSIVIMLIGSNIARAFSLAGAFALVRFRSVPGSAKDIAVVFLTMSVGLACGLGFVYFAIIVAAIVCLILVILSLSAYGTMGTEQKLLKITIPEDLNYKGLFDDLFKEYFTECKMQQVKTTNMGTLYELQYLVTAKKYMDEKALIDAIRCRNGNLNISLGMLPDKTGLML